MIRRGHKNRVEYLESLKEKVLPSQIKRIQQNDKSVKKDLVLAHWMDWDTLYEWSQTLKVNAKGADCILCDKEMPNGMTINDKFVCENCFLKIKNME